MPYYCHLRGYIQVLYNPSATCIRNVTNHTAYTRYLPLPYRHPSVLEFHTRNLDSRSLWSFARVSWETKRIGMEQLLDSAIGEESSRFVERIPRKLSLKAAIQNFQTRHVFNSSRNHYEGLRHSFGYLYVNKDLKARSSVFWEK